MHARNILPERGVFAESMYSLFFVLDCTQIIVSNAIHLKEPPCAGGTPGLVILALDTSCAPHLAKRTAFHKFHTLEVTFSGVQLLLNEDGPLQIFLDLFLELRSSTAFRSHSSMESCPEPHLYFIGKIKWLLSHSNTRSGCCWCARAGTVVVFLENGSAFQSTALQSCVSFTI